MARANTAGRIAAAPNRAPMSQGHTPSVTDDDIARRAYHLYLARGSADGHDVDDWLQAERELRPTPRLNAA